MSINNLILINKNSNIYFKYKSQFSIFNKDIINSLVSELELPFYIETIGLTFNQCIEIISILKRDNMDISINRINDQETLHFVICFKLNEYINDNSIVYKKIKKN